MLPRSFPVKQVSSLFTFLFTGELFLARGVQGCEMRKAEAEKEYDLGGSRGPPNPGMERSHNPIDSLTGEPECLALHVV